MVWGEGCRVQGYVASRVRIFAQVGLELEKLERVLITNERVIRITIGIVAVVLVAQMQR